MTGHPDLVRCQSLLESRAADAEVARAAYRMDTAGVARFRQEQADKYSRHRATFWWDEIDRDMGSMVDVDEEMSEAAATMAHADISTLVTILSKYEDFLAVARLTPLLRNDNELDRGLAWLHSSCSYKVFALGLSRLSHLLSTLTYSGPHVVIGEDPQEASPVDLEKTVAVVADALDARPTDEHVDLWCQFVAWARHFGQREGTGPHPQTVQLLELAADRVAGWVRKDHPGLDVAALGGQRWRGSLGPMSVLPYASARLDDAPEKMQWLRDAFLGLLENELESNPFGVTRWPCSTFVVDVRGAAIALLLQPNEMVVQKWQSLLDQWAKKPGGWGFDHLKWRDDVRRAGWLLCVGCNAAMLAHECQHEARVAMTGKVFGIIDQVWDDWMWHDCLRLLGPLPSYISHLCCVLEPAECSARTVRYSRAARTNGTIQALRAGAEARLENEARRVLDDLVAARTEYERQLEG